MAARGALVYLPALDPGWPDKNTETHAGILVAAPALSLTPLFTFLVPLGLCCLDIPSRERQGLEPQGRRLL